MKYEKGFTLVEVTIAIALMGIIGIAFLGGLATASRGIFTADEQAAAESLARSQMEYVKNLPYAATYTPASIPPGYTNYSATISTTALDSGLQLIRVTIYHDGEPILTSGNYTLETYRSTR